jgi:spore coat polysaccharide biosynthesis predicted glycosyltransferase SpsG/RimJ/RimL family protein N-acetyltransferase
MRCQALAQSLQPAFEATFIVREAAASIQQQLAAATIAIQLIPLDVPTGLPEAQWLANQLTATDILVLDGYHFGPAYQERLAATGAALVCLDDLVIPPLWATAILNQAGGVAPAAYSHVPLAQLLLGPAYALLRPEFWHHGPPAASGQPRLFLNMGGADPTNQTAMLLPVLRQQFPAYSLQVVTGAAYPHQTILQELIQPFGDAVVLHHNLAAPELATLLRTCQVFVCPPSGVAYECCATGGALLLHLTAENQRAIFDFLIRQGLAIPLAAGFQLQDEELPALAARQLAHQRQLFDGLAAQRLKAVFHHLAATQHYTIRLATQRDAVLYFEWANDPAVRRNAIHPEPIAWDTHVAWFARRLQDTDSYLYLLQSPDGKPIGQVRIEFDGVAQPGHIDYSLAPAYRGRGLGQVLLRRALQQLRHDRPALAGGVVQGQVKASNAASSRVFEELRFVRQAAVTLQGEAYEVFQLRFPSAS